MMKTMKKMNDKMLFPSCSEIVWRLRIDKPAGEIKRKILKALDNKKEKSHTTYMAGDFPNEFLKEMIDCIKEEQEYGYDLNDIKLKMVRNNNGEDWSFIKKCCKFAKLCLNKKMGRKEAKELLRNHFDEEQERELSEEEDE